MKRFACLLLLAVPAAAGAVIPMPDQPERPLEFGLSLGKTKTELTYADNGEVDSTLEFVELTWYERVYDGADIGLYVGKTFLSQSGRAATAGMEPDGVHGGVALRATFLQDWRIQPFVHALYTYRRVKDTNDAGDSVTLSWHEPQLRLGLSVLAAGPLRAYGGAHWSMVDGNERRRGAVSSTVDIERDGAVNGFVGLDLTVDTTGSVGVEAFTGDAGRGVEIYFRRRY